MDLKTYRIAAGSFLLSISTILQGEADHKSVIKSEIVTQTHDYVYSSLSKPNPFDHPPISSLLAQEKIPVTSSLQRYPLSQLKLAGLWELNKSTRKGLMTTPVHEGVVIEMNSDVGNRGGKVVELTDRSIVVREYSLAPDGSHIYEDYRIWLTDYEPHPPEFNVMTAKKLGRARQFGFGEVVKDVDGNEKDDDVVSELEKENKGDAP